MYSWDAENRLVRVMSYGVADRASWRREDGAYDALGRRIRQTSYMLSNGVWVVMEDLKFVSDPVWFGRHIAELNATNHAVVRSYVWGLDLSETLDSAGGVGGLLWVRLASGPASGTHFVTYDGNGNVWQLVSASTGTETARYEYGPFGEPLRATGPMAKSNPFRFSTKRASDPADLVLYEYRACSPSLGRWPNRDPILEIGFRRVFLKKRLKGGLHEYAFVRNNPISMHDVDGLGIGCAVKWASQVELGHAAPMNCAGSAIADALILLKSSYPNYDPKSNGHNALHCLANCLMAKYCHFPGKSEDEIFDHMMDANSDYELCTAKEELCGKWCGDQNAYRQDVMSDIKADMAGIRAGLAGQDCVAACEPETRTPGPKQPDSCDCRKVKECEAWYDKTYGTF
jgi:RHS repeat-associated protein